MKNEDMIPCQDLVEDSNNSNNSHFQTILDQYTSRRSFIAKTTSGAMALDTTRHHEPRSTCME